MTEMDISQFVLSPEDLEVLEVTRNGMRDLLINISRYLDDRDVSIQVKGWKQFAMNRELALFVLFMTAANLHGEVVDDFLEEMIKNVKKMLLDHAEVVKQMKSSTN